MPVLGYQTLIFHTIQYTAAAAYAKTEEQRILLWERINTMSQQAKKGKETNITALWFFPVGVVSFV